MATVLVIDDELPVAMVIARILRRDGLDTVGARSAADAISMLAGEAIDAVVCDVSLSDGEAADVLAAMDDLRRRIPVVLVSGRPKEELVRREAEHSLVVDVIRKPFDVAALRAAVQRALARVSSGS